MHSDPCISFDLASILFVFPFFWIISNYLLQHREPIRAQIQAKVRRHISEAQSFLRDTYFVIFAIDLRFSTCSNA